MTYCYRCNACSRTVETNSTKYTPVCAVCHYEMNRDYRAEAVGIGSGVRVSRTGTAADQAALFLPTNKDFAGPGDPDGKKGMREWRDSHVPKSGNKRPFWPGEVERKSFAVGAP